MAIDKYDYANRTGECLVAKFYQDVCDQVNHVKTTQRFDKWAPLHPYLNSSEYLYNKRLKVFKDPIAHLYKDRLSRDDYGNHQYLECFILSMYSSMNEMKINTVKEPPRPVHVITYSQIWYYPSVSIMEISDKVLKYTNSKNGCTIKK